MPQSFDIVRGQYFPYLVFGRAVKIQRSLFLKPLQGFLQDMDTIPQGHKGDPEEEAKRTSKLGDKRGPRVDQCFRFHKGVVGHCVETEQVLFCFETGHLFLSFDPILEIVTGLATACSCVDPIKVLSIQFTVELLVFPYNI